MIRALRRWFDRLHYNVGLCGDLYCRKCKAIFQEETRWN